MKRTLVIICILFFLSVLPVFSDEVTFNLIGWTVKAELTETESGYIARNVKFDEGFSYDRLRKLEFDEIILNSQMAPVSDYETENVAGYDLDADNGFEIDMEKAVLKMDGKHGPGIYIQGLIQIKDEILEEDIFLKNTEADFYVDPQLNLYTGIFNAPEIEMTDKKFNAEEMYIGKVPGKDYCGLIITNLELSDMPGQDFCIPYIVLDGNGYLTDALLPEKAVFKSGDITVIADDFRIENKWSGIRFSGWLIFTEEKESGDKSELRIYR